MFQTQLRRDPTNVELFDIAQSNSEHSRHWFFKADLWLDGEKTPHSLFDLVKAPLKVCMHVRCHHIHMCMGSPYKRCRMLQRCSCIGLQCCLEAP